MPKNIRLNSAHCFILKIQNKRELQQIAFNHSPDIDFKDFMNIYNNLQIFTIFSKPYSFLVIFHQIILHVSELFIMTIDEKLQYDIKREAAKISALSSGKIDEYEYLTAEEIFPSNKRQIIDQDNFAYSPLQKACEKQTKKIEDQGKQQIKTIEDHEIQLF